MIYKKFTKIFLIFLCLVSLTTVVEAEVPILEELTVETYPEVTKIIFNFNQPTNMILYTIENPPQIIADVVGDTLALSSGIETNIPINHGQTNKISVFKDPALGDAHLYGIDFFIIDLKENVAFTASRIGNTYSIYIANSKDQTLAKIERDFSKPKSSSEQKEVEERIERQLKMRKLRKEKQKVEVSITAKPTYTIKEKTKETQKRKRAELQPRVLEGAVRQDRARKDNIQLAREWRQIGYGHQVKEELQKAIEGYKQAIELDPDYACAHNDLGIMYYFDGNPKQAVEEFTKAISIDPNYLGAYTNLALIYEQLGEIDKAVECWQKRTDLGAKNDPWMQKAKEKIQQLK